MKKIFTLFAALAMVMSMSAVPYLKGSFNGWGESNSLQSGSTDVTLNANATYEFKVNDGSNWYGNNGTMTSTNCTDWTMSTSGGNCKIKTTIAGVYTFKWNASSKKLSVVYPTEAVEINYYITGSGNLVGGDGWKANEIKMTNNDGTYTYTFTNLAAGNYEMKITQGNWDNTLGFSNLATSYVGVTGNNDNNIVMALADATNLTVTVTGTTVSLSLPEKTNTIYFVNEKGWAKVNAYVWTDNPYKPWPGEAMTKVEGKTYGGKDVYTYTYPANNSKVIFNDGGSNQTGDLTYSEATPYYYNDKWNASIAYDKAKYTVTVTAENGTVEGAGEYEEGKEATLTATPNEGYEFVNWTVAGEEVSTEATYSFTVTADVEVVANFKEAEPEYNVVEDEITNLNIDTESMCIIGGPSAEFGVDVFLALTEQNQDGTWALSDESSVAIQGIDATFIDGYAYDIDLYAPAVKVVLRVEFGGSNYELHIDMVSKPVVIEIADAIVSKEEYPDGMGGTYTNWTMDGQWSDGETTYPVLVNMPDFDPTIVEADMTVTITIGSWVEVMYGAAEGSVHATVAENVVTLTGTLTSYAAGTWEVTISGTLPAVPSALDNLNTTVAPVKMIENGQLIIVKDGVQYNAQGAILK